MFLATSRYALVAQDTVNGPDGQPLLALRLRPLPPTAGEAHRIRDHDRLDTLAQAGYADGARFWHIADANAALDARQLTVTVGAILKLPKT